MIPQVVLFQLTLFSKKALFFQKNRSTFEINLIALNHFKNKFILCVILIRLYPDLRKEKK